MTLKEYQFVIAVLIPICSFSLYFSLRFYFLLVESKKKLYKKIIEISDLKGLVVELKKEKNNLKANNNILEWENKNPPKYKKDDAITDDLVIERVTRSKRKKDYLTKGLCSILLVGVFPLLYDNKTIFKKRVWMYRLKNTKNDTSIKLSEIEIDKLVKKNKTEQ